MARLDRPPVAVPLLLTAGYHARVDIPAGLDGADAVATPPLGPDPWLLDLLVRRLAAVAAGPVDAVVLAAAGSTDPRAASTSCGR